MVAPFRTRPYCQHYYKLGHFIDRCFDLYPEFKPQLNQNRGGGLGGGRGHGTPQVMLRSAIAEVEPMHVELPDLNQL